MKARYKNPWYGKVKGAFGKVVEMPEFYESDSELEQYAGCIIYARQEWGFPIFDVVVDGVCRAQRATLRGARNAAEQKPWNWEEGAKS